MTTRFTMIFEINGKRELRISPYVTSKREAALWLYKIKPLAFVHLDTFEIRPYKIGDR